MTETMKTMLYRWADVPREQMSALLDRRFVSGEHVTLARVGLKKGCVVPRHVHENEQFSLTLSGALKFWIGEDESEVVVVSSGEMLHLPPNVPHKAEAMEDTEVLDIFSPPRHDWLEGTDAYLRNAPAQE